MLRKVLHLERALAIVRDVIIHAPSGDLSLFPLPLVDWPTSLVNPAYGLEINRRFYGYAVRTDRWSCKNKSCDWHTIYLIRSGEIHGGVSGIPYRLGAGDLIWVSNGAILDMVWPDHFVFTEIWFRLNRSDASMRLPEPLLIRRDADNLWTLFDELQSEITGGSLMSDQKLQLLLATLIIEIIRMENPPGPSGLGPTQRQQVVRHLHQSPRFRCSPAEMASIVGLTPDYFSRQFHASFGCSPRDFVIRERIREAARLLTTTHLTVYQIADRLGYANAAQFGRQFHKITGRSPGRYRQTH